MSLNNRKIQAISWLLLTLVWAVIIGLFLPRTPSYGRPILAATFPFLLYGVFAIAAHNTTKAANSESESTADSNRRTQKQVPVWIYGGVTSAVVLKNVIQAVFDESSLEFLVLSILLGWPWFEIAWRSSAYFHRFLGFSRSFLASISLSAVGLGVGLLIYSVKQEQVLSLFLTLTIISFVCASVIGMIESSGKQLRR